MSTTELASSIFTGDSAFSEEIIFGESSPFTEVKTDWRIINDVAERLGKRVFGQERALHAVASAVIQARAGFVEPDKPAFTGLFTGESGSGKTETGLAVAEYLMEDDPSWKERVRLINGGEFQEPHSIAKITGGVAGYHGYGDPNALMIHPEFTEQGTNVIIIDEFEKANESFRKLMLQILDKAELRVPVGTEVNMHGQWINVKPQLLDFRKSWIIITSNIGSGLLAGARRGRPLGFGSPSEEVDTQAIGNKALKEAFTYMPELLNRIPSSNRVTFDLLDADAMSRIFDKHMATLCPTASDEIQVTPRLKSWILSRSDPAEGGRHLMDVIREVLIKAAAPVRLKVGRGIPLVAGLDTSDGNLVRFAVLKDFMRPQSGFELSPPDKALQSVKLLTPAASGGLYLPPSYSR